MCCSVLCVGRGVTAILGGVTFSCASWGCGGSRCSCRTVFCLGQLLAVVVSGRFGRRAWTPGCCSPGGHIGKGVCCFVWVFVSVRTGFGWLVGHSSVSQVCMHGAGGSGALGVAGWERATRRCAFKSLSYIITRVAPHCVNTLRILHAAYDTRLTRHVR